MKLFTEKSSKNLIWVGVILLFIGLFSFQIGEEIFDINSEIKSDKIGQLGDFFGGVIGSIWALAGVILFYVAFNKQVEALEDQKRSTTAAIDSLKVQTTELQLQRTELKETRKEFLMNRTTNIVYHQLDRFEKSIRELVIKGPLEMDLQGDDAISYLDDNRNTVYQGTYDSQVKYIEDLKKAIIKNLKVYTHNKSNIETFARNAYNSVEILKRLVYKTNLDIEELNDIKDLFFVNIGFINMGVIEKISEVVDQELKHLKTQDYIDNNLEPGELRTANIFLKSIKEFYQLKLTDKNFKTEKEKWLKRI